MKYKRAIQLIEAVGESALNALYDEKRGDRWLALGIIGYLLEEVERSVLHEHFEHIVRNSLHKSKEHTKDHLLGLLNETNHILRVLKKSEVTP